MNDEEIRSSIEQIRTQVKANPENKDKSDDEIDELILDSFFKSYTEGEMTKEDLLGLAEAMGYEPDEGFESDPEAPSQVEPGKSEGEGGEGGEGGVSKDTLENTRTMEPGQSAEDFKDKIEAAKGGQEVGGGEGSPAPAPGSAEGSSSSSAPASDPAPAPASTEGGEGSKGEESEEEKERKAASELWKIDLTK